MAIANLYLYTDSTQLRPLLSWLADVCSIGPEDIAAVLSDDASPNAKQEEAPFSVRRMSLATFAESRCGSDCVIAAGLDLDKRIAALFSAGVRMVYDGNAILERASVIGRFSRAAERFFLGPMPELRDDPASQPALRFTHESLSADRIPRHKLFIVNSMPKSGTIWMTAMLERLLHIRARDQIIISHVADITQDWGKSNAHGAVTVVRDLRDVVVSWFHHSKKTDVALGYCQPRYPTIESFYWEFFIGTLKSCERYFRGDLERWIDLMCAHYVPLVRYEDMHKDACTALSKVLNTWRIACDDEKVRAVVDSCTFDNLRAESGQGEGYVDFMLRSGHLRSGKPACWMSELPPRIAADVDRRFAGYQSRLGYAPSA